MFGNSKVIKNLKNLTLEKNLEDHFKRISSEIKEAIEKNRPVLVFF